MPGARHPNFGSKRKRQPRREQTYTTKTPQIPRPEQEVFEELRALCQSPGYIHTLSLLVFKANVVLSDGTVTKDDYAALYHHDNPIRTEINLLAGLMLSAKVDLAIQQEIVIHDQANRTIELLAELHQAILAPAHEEFTAAMTAVNEFEANIKSPLKSGRFLREAIFYGGESAFYFQYVDMAKSRYAPDKEWLIDKLGFDIVDAAKVMQAILDNLKNKYGFMLREIIEASKGLKSILPHFTFSADEIAASSGLSLHQATAVIEAFTVNECDPELDIENASSYNKVASHPIIKLSDGRFIAFLEYGLSESLYEAPFYWIAKDKRYLGKHSQTRGSFTENMCADALTRVFGPHRVIRNVEFHTKSGGRLGEADVVLKYGHRLLLIQAKSKKLTLDSRKGDDLAIGRDFQSAVQDAYDQAINCIEHIRAGASASSFGQAIPTNYFEDIKRFYPICITSEHYPALAAQSRELLEVISNDYTAFPIVTDIFTLDVIAEMLNTPLYFTDYITKRADAADRIVANHELVILSWYIKKESFY